MLSQKSKIANFAFIGFYTGNDTLKTAYLKILSKQMKV